MNDDGGKRGKGQSIGHREGGRDEQGRVFLVFCDIEFTVSDDGRGFVTVTGVIERDVGGDWEVFRIKRVREI